MVALSFLTLFAACLGEDINPIDPSAGGDPLSSPNPPGEKTPATCAASAFCRLENPTDTLSLSSEQKERTRQLLDDTLGYSRAGILRMDTSSIQGDSLRLDLFPDVVLTMQLKEVPTTNPDSRNLTGEIVGDPGGSVTLSFLNGNLVLGSFQYGDKSYSLFSLGDGLVLVREVQIMWPVDCVDSSVGYACY